MTTSDQGVQMIQSFEGLRLNAYLDVAGVPTIGYGHTAGVTLGQTCTMYEATAWLRQDLGTAERCVDAAVKTLLSQAQFDALVSFVFNVGCGAFKKSTLLRLLNDASYTGAGDAFLSWIYANGKQEPGLYNRRVKERQVFLRGYA